ncbi:hypothetical protein [Methanobacterium paludis]|uniref:Uncharacterized protein n=1 Tax=Methanobacterium paludis (strain DSM 25820 / JCM 18151 / SWAN1) TaxID=868131 RepID=F6D2B1_METPW|nr:hypothetical protein [Methanobacterium paludis]AEG18628.1 hypothetical protein MSWAN_1617 [Methanobacterium paludis]
MSSENEVLAVIDIVDRMSDAVTEMTIQCKTPLAPDTYDTGEVFQINLIDPTLQEGYSVVKGTVERVKRDDLDNNRIYEIYGRNIARMLTKQPFKYDCTKPENSKTNSVLDLLNLILTDTGIKIGRGQALSQDITLNTSSTGIDRFCGSWDTKKDAIDQLFSQYVKLSGVSKFRWYVDLSGYLRWFETKNNRMGSQIYIFEDQDNVLTFLVTKDATNIVNDQKGYAGDNNSLTAHATDTASIAKYGHCIGPDITESDMTQAQLNARVQLEIDQKSQPVYTATLKLRGFYDYEKGTQINFPNNPNYSDINFTITDRTFHAEPTASGDGAIYTEFNLSTDETVISIVNEFDTIYAAAKTEADKVKCQVGTAQADAANGRVLVYVNDTGTVENLRSP